MNNFKGNGERITITAATSYTKGLLYALGDRSGLAMNDAVSGELVTFLLKGEISGYTKEAEALSLGAKVYRKASNGNLTATDSGNKPAGWATETTTSSQLTTSFVLGAW